MTTVVGVDVGGSGTRCQTVVDGTPGPVHAGAGVRIGPAGIDVETLVASVVPLVPTGADVVVWAMRGMVALADPHEVVALLRDRLRPGRVVLAGDAVASMVGAVGGVRTGAVVAAGSGAVAFATDFDRTWRRVDGWGHVLGDRGSSAWVGLEALRRALRTLDGVDPGGEALLTMATEALGRPDVWPRTVMTRPDAVSVLAGLAPLVAALAATDPVAAEICAEAGRSLARSLAAAAAGLEGVCLSRTGGLFAAPAVLRAFDEEATVLGLDVRPPVGGGLDGAVLLATHLAEGHPLTGHDAYLLMP